MSREGKRDEGGENLSAIRIEKYAEGWERAGADDAKGRKRKRGNGV